MTATPSPSHVPVRIGLLLALVAGLVLAGATVPTPVEAVTPVVVEEVPVEPGPAWADAATPGVDTSAVQHVRPFAMLGLALPDEVEVEVRTARGDGPWSPWTAVPHAHEEAPDPGGPEASAAARHLGDDRERTDALLTGPADRLQVRALHGRLDGISALLVDPFGLDRSPLRRAVDTAAASWRGTPREAATATVADPPIVTRAAWGADESLVTSPPAYGPPVDRAFVHHTAGGNDYTQAQAPGVVRGILAYHVNGRGWRDIGYSFLVDRFGTIYEGRAGGVDRPVLGAHAGGFNSGSLGIAVMGTFSGGPPAAAALDSLTHLTAWLADVHHFDPTGIGVARSLGSSRYPAGTEVTLANLATHRDVSATGCPGDALHGHLPDLRTASREAAGDLIVDHDLDVARTRVVRGDPDVDAVTATARLDPPGRWQVQVTDPAGDVILRATGDGAEARATLALDGGGWALGDYTVTTSSPGRRAAVSTLALVPPVIEDPATSTGLALAGPGGVLDPPLRFGATLWHDAAWRLVLTDPAGQVVDEQAGVGAALDAGWSGPVDLAGTYAWTMLAEDAAPVGGTVEVRHDLLDRLADAADPVAAATLLSRAAFEAGEADHAVIARVDVFADALAGGPLAGTDGPLLLTSSDALDSRVVDELRRVLAPGATIEVLGGPAAISEDVVADLRGLAPVRRLSGSSRVATAAAVAEVVVERSGTSTAMVARAGPDDAAPWADALAGGAFGAAAGIPVLLTDGQRLSQETARALRDLGIDSTIILGGTAAISDAVAADLPAPLRVAGPDRHATAAVIATDLWTARGPVEDVLLANGGADGAWAWALAASPLAARAGSPLLLTGDTALATPAAAALEALGASGGAVVGPTALVPAEVAYAASDLVRR